MIKQEKNDIEKHIRSIKENNRYGFQILLHYLALNGEYLINASEKIKDNYQAVKTSVIQNGKSIAYASYRLQGNKELALIAVNHDGENIRYLTDEIKSDKEVIDVAVKNKPMSLYFIPDQLQNNLEYLKLLKNQEEPLPLFSKFSPLQMWYKEKMAILDMLENEDWMEKHIQSNDYIQPKTKKF